MQKNIAIKLQNISKIYKLYEKPIDRLKESIHPFKKKYHKNFYALKDIKLEIKKGEVLGIVGVNGAGKSTLLKIISGVMTPTAGRVNIHGKVNAILELGASLKPEMTGRENIKLNLQINGIEDNKEKITQEIIEFADIGEYIEQPIKTYSSGMKARLGFGIATSTDPDVLIVDEVLAVGDVLFQRKCYGKIQKLFKDGKTVIFVSHSTHSIIEFCSRAVLLYDKKIILDSDPKTVTEFYQKLIFSNNKKMVLGEMGFIENYSPEKQITKKPDIDEDYYLSDLKTKPNIVKNYAVEVMDMAIRNVNGKKVNVLKIGNSYSINYKVRFDTSCRNVKFGHLIKTEKGSIISGETLPDRKKPIPFVEEGETFSVSSSFVADFVPGTYFVDAGATSDINDVKVYLIMKYDFFIFRVQGDSFNFWGQCNIWKEQKVLNELSG